MIDQCNNPLALTLGPSLAEKLVFKLKYDPQAENEALDEMPYFKKIFWKVILNSFEDEFETVVVSSSEEAGKSSFCYSEAENSIESSLDISKVRSDFQMSLFMFFARCCGNSDVVLKRP